MLYRVKCQKTNFMEWIPRYCTYSVQTCTYIVHTCTNLAVWTWLWQFGRGKPLLGGLSCEETDERKEAALQERSLRGAETRRRRKADRAWWEVNCGFEAVQTCLYYVYTYVYNYDCVCTMYIHMYIIINVYVHVIYISTYLCTCLYTFMILWTCIHMYRHVCTMFRHVCTVLPIFIHVYRIPDETWLLNDSDEAMASPFLSSKSLLT